MRFARSASEAKFIDAVNYDAVIHRCSVNGISMCGIGNTSTAHHRSDRTVKNINALFLSIIQFNCVRVQRKRVCSVARDLITINIMWHTFVRVISFEFWTVIVNALFQHTYKWMEYMHIKLILFIIALNVNRIQSHSYCRTNCCFELDSLR